MITIFVRVLLFSEVKSGETRNTLDSLLHFFFGAISIGFVLAISVCFFRRFEFNTSVTHYYRRFALAVFFAASKYDDVDKEKKTAVCDVLLHIFTFSF